MLKSTVKRALADIQTVSYNRIRTKIDKYDEISFDIFDTLIKRDVPTPKDVFRIIEFNTGEADFAQKRIRAEKQARIRKGEVTLDDIYDEYDGITEEKKQLLIKTEEEHEINLCQVNLKMLPIYEYACQHKRVLISSDMYLSRAVIEKILEKNLITGYESLIISNELNKTKADGSMYDCIRKQFNCKKLLHIGNSFKADYLQAKKHHIASVKIRTNTKWLGRKYKPSHSKENECLEAFLSNRHKDENEYYYTFGYERFGPVLYGFICWLLNQMTEAGIEQVLFMARDGYIMQKAYKALGYDQIISNQYFEVSRRSLRVPAICKSAELADIMNNNSLIALSSIEQLMDNFGLDANQYTALIDRYHFGGDKRFNRDELVTDESFNAFYEEIKPAVQKNAEKEMTELLRYLSQFDFSKKTGIVDIGWGGTMQRHLVRTLNDYQINNNITGYYLGMSKRWKNQTDNKDLYKAKGYLFDCLNKEESYDMVIPFRSLFETLFLEQKGSVKCYQSEGKKTVAIRYDYEYEQDGKPLPEAVAVKSIHDGAIDFIKAINESKIKGYIGTDPETMLYYLYQTGTDPCADDLDHFGDFVYFDNGKGNMLAPKRRLAKYIINPKRFIRDFSDAQWKVGFLKRALKIPLPYKSIYMFLRKKGIKNDIS